MNDRADFVGIDNLAKRCVIVHGMTAEIHSRDFVFHMEQLIGGKFLHRRYLGLVGALSAAVHIKEGELTAHCVAVVVFQIVEDIFADGEQLTAVCAQTVKGSAFYKAFNSAAVHMPAVKPLAEIVKRAVRRCSALGYNIVDKRLAEVFDSQQAVADVASAYGKAEIAFVDIGRKHGDAQMTTFGDVGRELVLIVEHA